LRSSSNNQNETALKFLDVSHRSFSVPLTLASARRVALALTERSEKLIAAIAQSSQESLGYVVIADVDCLIRYHVDEIARETIGESELLLCAGWASAMLVYLLRGAWPAVCSGRRLIETLLSFARPSDRILWIGGRHLQIHELACDYNLMDLRHYSFARGAPDSRSLYKCIEYIEREAPFRFCVLAIESAQGELIARALSMRKRARGAVLCVGELKRLRRRATQLPCATPTDPL
jgi:hypothetical protein